MRLVLTASPPRRRATVVHDAVTEDGELAVLVVAISGGSGRKELLRFMPGS